MFIPFISSPKPQSSSARRLSRRKGGGGGGHGSSSGGGRSSSGKSSGSKGGNSIVINSRKTRSGSVQRSSPSTLGGSGSTYKTSTYTNNPPIPISIIPNGQIFAGRSIGGGSRNSIFGTRTYGSGYPNIAERGTSGRGFPFVFWPLTWGLALGAGSSILSGSNSNSTTAGYLNTTIEYGNSTNTTRPGGPLTIATFTSLSGSPPSTFYVLSDNTTITSLITDLSSNCTSFLSSTNTSMNSPFIDTPRPEQVIQYYRSSSIALALEGYNNSATYSSDTSAPDSLLPSTVDMNLMQCLNETIGVAAPIPDDAMSSKHGLLNMSYISLAILIGLFLILW